MSESAACGLASLPPQLSSAGSDCVACPAVHPRAHSPLPSCQTSPGPCAGLDGVSFLHSNPSHSPPGNVPCTPTLPKEKSGGPMLKGSLDREQALEWRLLSPWTRAAGSPTQ